MLDTHFLVWLADDPTQLRPKERAILDRSDQMVVASAISLWEIRVKRRAEVRRNKPLLMPSTETVITFAAIAGIEIVALSIEDYGADLDVGLTHHDPFDEMLLVHAQQLGARFLTRDDDLIAHPLSLPL